MNEENEENAPAVPPPCNSTEAPAAWFGTPMEMVADAFGMESPRRNRASNWKRHVENVRKRRDRREKLAKESRKRNRRRK